MSNVISLAERDLPRSSISWFLIAYLLTVLPQLFIYLPIWIVPIFAVCFIWRAQIYRSRANYPRGFIKFLIIFCLLATMYVVYGNFFNTLGCSILLLALYSLKFVEAKTVRDGWILALLGYFAIAITYLYNNNVFVTLYSLLSIIAVTCGMLGLEQSTYHRYSQRYMLGTVIKLLALAIPLMVVLFVAFPRLPSFLSLSQATTEGTKTGISNSMTPGDISKLVNDNSHMFWAEFSERVPAKRDLYWRVLTLDEFDGRSWKQSYISTTTRFAPSYHKQGLQQNYNIVFEPTQQHYLATLDISEAINQFTNEYNFYEDFRVETKLPIVNKIRYDMGYYPNSAKELNLGQSQRKLARMTFLPENVNPRIRTWVNSRMARNETPEAFVNTLLAEFTRNEFYYTLEPPALGTHSIDEFFFETRRGFCEHYASTLAFMLRVANIPARVVIGYLGGAVDDAQRRVQVRGMEAHAWVEYWVANKGWIRVDPTGAVAPSRIEQGMAGLFSEEESRAILGTNAGFLGSLTFKLTALKDALEYRWAKFILGYQGDVQRTLFERFLGAFSWYTLLKLSFGFVALFFSAQIILFTKPWRKLYFDLSLMYQECQCLLYKERGLMMDKGVAPRELYKQAAVVLTPNEARILHELVMTLERVLFTHNKAMDREQIKRVKVLFTKFKKILKSNHDR